MDEGPKKQPTTVQMQAPPDWAIALSERVAQGIAGIERRFDKMEATVDTLVEDGKTSNQRMTKIELRLDAYEERASRSSERAKSSNRVDMRHDAAIASIIEKVDALAAKPDTAALVLAKLGEAAKTPTGQKVFGSLATILLLLLAVATLKLQATVQKLEERPQAAPSAVDAGVR